MIPFASHLLTHLWKGGVWILKLRERASENKQQQ
jgi:hypothetical protein